MAQKIKLGGNPADSIDTLASPLTLTLQLRCWLLRLCCLLLGTVHAFGQQYGFRMFGQDDGLLNLTVKAVLQDQEGFLWVGSANGVFRYDGVAFTRFATKDGLPAAYVAGIVESSDRTLWVATHGGVARWSGGRFLMVPLPGNPSLVANRVNATPS